MGPQLRLVTLVTLLGMGPAAAWGTVCATSADCVDGNVCNGTEVCQAGVCIPGTSIVCDDHDPCTIDSCEPLTGCTFTPANGCLLTGKKLRLGIGAELRIGFKTGPEMSGVAFPANYTNDDPVVHGASIRVLAGKGDRFDNVYPLPRASWEYLEGAGQNVGYQYKDLVGEYGPVTLLVIRNGKPAKMKARGAALNFSLGSNPAPVEIALRFGDEGRRYCLEFGGRIKFFPGVRFTALGSTAPGSCPTCASALDCDDGDPCTTDSCTGGACQSVPISCVPPAVCVAGVCQ